MKYRVMCRNRNHLDTDSIKEARVKMFALGETAYIQYNESGVALYESTHKPVLGERE